MDKLQISLSKNGSLSEFEPVVISSIHHLADLVLENSWSGGIFKDNHRLAANFLTSDVIGLDIDGGFPLSEAVEIFQQFSHVIATTKSHQVEKNGIIDDRYRVILVLDRTITNREDFDATWHSLKTLFPFIDPACKDPSRFYYPCLEIVSASDGVPYPVKKGEPKPEKKASGLVLTNLEGTKLARGTLEFLVQGAPEGSWNRSLFKAAKDWQEQGLTQEEFEGRALGITGVLDETDLKTIQSAFSKEPEYEPRIIQHVSEIVIRAQDLIDETIAYLDDKDLVYGEPTGIAGLDKLIGGGKRLGEVTAWHAEAKTGKNTLWHFMQCLWFKRARSQGYASRELQPSTEVIPDYLSILRGSNARTDDVTESLVQEYRTLLAGCPMFFARGYGHFELHQLKQWVKGLKLLGVQYFWFDHLHYMLEDPEDHKAASKLIKEIKELALTEQIHIDLIIQPNKLSDGQKLSLNSIKGGSAMGQAIDNLIILERVKGTETPNVMKLTLDVARSKLCKLGHFYLKYDPQTLTFTEVEYEATQQEEPYRYESSSSPIRKLRSIE